jgi:methyl-accepting chemotaxis protein
MPLLGNGSASGSLRRRTITAKTSATSAVALLCLLGMGVIVAVTSGDVARNLHELSAQNLPSRGAAAAVNNDVVAAHMRVFRYVSWASNSVSHTLLQSLRKDIGADFHRIDRDFNALSERPGVSSAETTDLAALRDKLDKYKRTAKDVLDVGSTDAAMATMMLGQTDDRYTSIEADIRKILIAMSDQSNSIVDDLASATSRETLSLTIGLLACLAFLIVGIIFIAKSIVRPITSITRAMQKLSSGDTDVKLGYHGRGDEIGRMIEAIEIFRRNALEIQAIQISRREADE